MPPKEPRAHDRDPASRRSALQPRALVEGDSPPAVGELPDRAAMRGRAAAGGGEVRREHDARDHHAHLEAHDRPRRRTLEEQRADASLAVVALAGARERHEVLVDQLLEALSRAARGWAHERELQVVELPLELGSIARAHGKASVPLRYSAYSG